MKNNLEIRIHARAGQGSKTMAQFIAESVAKLGRYVQAFPHYGPARSGAPMDAYVRISDKEIRIHSPIKNPDFLIILDDSLLQGSTTNLNLGNDQVLLINTKKSIDQVKKDYGVKGKIFAIDASKIAIELFKKDYANTVMLGVLAKASDQIDIKDFESIVKEKFLKKLGEELTNKNITAINRGYEEG